MSRAWSLGLVGVGVLYAVFYVLPLGAFLRTSFLEAAGSARVSATPTLRNYAEVFGDAYSIGLFATTLQLSASTAFLSVLIAYPVAFTIARSRTRWGSTIFLIVVASMFTSFIVGALGVRVLVGDTGPINTTLMNIGVIAEPIRFANSMGAVIVGLVHATVPLAVLGLLPACEAIPRELLEAAQGLGASRWRTFWRVTFPQTRLAVVGAALLTFSVATGAFVTPLLLGGGRVRVLGIEIRQQILGLLNYPVGAAYAVALVIIVFAIAALALTFGRQRLRGASM